MGATVPLLENSLLWEASTCHAVIIAHQVCVLYTRPWSETAPMSLPPQQSPRPVRSIRSAQIINSMRTGETSHPLIHPHYAWSSGSARRKKLGTNLSNKGFTDLCCNVPEIAALWNVSYFYKENQPGTALPKATHCYNRIPFLPSLHPPIF